MKRDRCGGCGQGGDWLTDVLDLGTSPLADEFPTDPQASLDAKRYPIGLMQCSACSLVQLSEIVPDEDLWAGDYGFYSGSSGALVEYMRAYARWLVGSFPLKLARGFLEVACNDGTLMAEVDRIMQERERAVAEPRDRTTLLGVDPALGPTTQARDRGLNVITSTFGRAEARRIVAMIDEPLGVIVANNVIAHVTDPGDVLAGIDLLLARDGVAVIEFQYVVDLLVGNGFDHVYHEHRSFFSLTSLAALAEPYSLFPMSVVQTPAQGGSLRVVFRRGQGVSGSHADHSVKHLLRAEQWLSEPFALAGLQGRADRIKTRLMESLHAARTAGKRVAGYGASAKATTLFAWCGIGDNFVQYVVDTTPTKHGRYVPGTRVPIIAPSADSRAPDIYLLGVHNYLPQILAAEQPFRAGGGRFLVPIPAPVLL